jgi:hypothetical protein
MNAIAQLAHDLKLRLIIEGVETQEQLTVIEKHAVHGIQGYIFARPMTAADLLPMIGNRVPTGRMGSARSRSGSRKPGRYSQVLTRPGRRRPREPEAQRLLMQRPNYPSGKDLLSADAVSRFDLDDIIERAERHLHEEELERPACPCPSSRRPRAAGPRSSPPCSTSAARARASASRPRLRRLGHQSIDAYDTDRSRMGTATGESIEDHIHTVEL